MKGGNYYSASIHNSNSIIREVICFLRGFRSHWLRWKGIIYLPAVLIYCQMTQLVQIVCLFFWSIIQQWQNVETNSSFPLFFINTVCLSSAANSCPFANLVCVCEVLILCTVSIYCPFVAGGSGSGRAYALMHELHGHAV